MRGEGECCGLWCGCAGVLGAGCVGVSRACLIVDDSTTFPTRKKHTKYTLRTAKTSPTTSTKNNNQISTTSNTIIPFPHPPKKSPKKSRPK